MKYIYYRPNGDISAFSPVPDPASKDPYIEVEDSEAEGFFNGTKLHFVYKVIPDPDMPVRGWVEPKYQLVSKDTWIPVTDRIYAVPKNTADAAFVIQQDCKNKKILVKLTPRASAWWKDNQYFKLPSLFLVACRTHDPHLFLWTHHLPPTELENVYEFDYSGEDQIVFYTRKIFNSYSHELLS